MKLDEAIENLKKFILSIDLSGTPGQDLTSGLYMSTEDGAIILNQEELKNYDLSIQMILDNHPSKDLLSKKSLEKMTQRAIISSLDPENKYPQKTREQKASEALKVFKNTLLAKKKFHLYYPVENVILDQSPQQFGEISFCLFDEKELQKFFSSISESLPDKQKLIRKNMYDDLRNNPIYNHTVALIYIEAVDNEAASIIAQDKLQKTLNVINFFVDLVIGKETFAYKPGDYSQTVTTIPILVGDDGGSIIMYNTSRPIFRINLNEIIKKCGERNLGLSRAGDLLRNRKNKLEQRLFAAIQWAGKATAEFNPEEAFLLYAIALETIILSDNDREELTYRLRIRLAHLIGKEPEKGGNPDYRNEIVDKVKNLYNIRSKIVHTGNYAVSEAELFEIRLMTKLSILHILNHDPFRQMHSIDDLRYWFENEILK